MKRLGLYLLLALLGSAGFALAQHSVGSPPIFSSPGPPASANLADAGAWTAYSPSLSCGSGTLTTASATGRSKTVFGKTTFVEMQITLTTLGTCASFLSATLPNTANSVGSLTGRDAAVNGVGFVASIGAATTTANFVNASGTFALTAGQVINVSGVYENQ